jgi:hypothetical protein
VAETDGARRNQAWRRCSHQVNRERGEERVSKGERRRPVGTDRATGLARLVGLALIGGPGPTSGPGMAERERGEREVFLTRN